MRHLFFILLIFSPMLFADSWMMVEKPEEYYSANNQIKVEVIPSDNFTGAIAKLYENVDSTKTFKLLRTFKLLNEHFPCDCLVSDDGNYVITIDDWHSVGLSELVVVIYDSLGTVIDKFNIHDFVSDEITSQMNRSVSSLWWDEDYCIEELSSPFSSEKTYVLQLKVKYACRSFDFDSVEFKNYPYEYKKCMYQDAVIDIKSGKVIVKAE